MAELIITLPDGREVRQMLGPQPRVIGRDAACDIPVDDPGTSRRHARFVSTSGGYLIEDLGSKNGTLVNDTSCVSRMLQNGDCILIGSVRAVFLDEGRPSTHSVVISDDVTATRATRYVSRGQQLDLSQQRLRVIYDLSGRLTKLQGRGQLLEDAMSICFEMLHFDRGAIGIRKPDQRNLDWPVVRNLRDTAGGLTISRTLLDGPLHGERAIHTDQGPDAADPTESMVQHGIRSAMCVPMMHNEQILGVIYGDCVHSSAGYTNEDVDFFGGIAQQVSIGLINCRLLEEQQQMIRLNHDIDLARTIQTQLFPAELPNRERIRVAALNDPGQRVSGDYYDAVETEDGRVWCLVADVTGEGVAAALMMANFQAIVRVTIDTAEDPAQILSRWNRVICRNAASAKFITCLLALIEPQSGRVQFSAAGHPAPILVRSTGALPEELAVEPAFPLGVREDAEYANTTLDPGLDPFVLLCYTDGVFEAMNLRDELFGVSRIREVVGNWRDLSPQALVKHVRKAVADFAAGHYQTDDITILAARVG